MRDLFLNQDGHDEAVCPSHIQMKRQILIWQAQSRCWCERSLHVSESRSHVLRSMKGFNFPTCTPSRWPSHPCDFFQSNISGGESVYMLSQKQHTSIRSTRSLFTYAPYIIDESVSNLESWSNEAKLELTSVKGRFGTIMAFISFR